MARKRVASERADAVIIGGGFFGLSLAAYLSQQGLSCVVLELGPALMQRASLINQARVHNGYHYPRSLLTALRSRANYDRFRRDYAACIVDDFEKLYAVPRKFSKVSARQFRLFMERIGAPIERASLAHRRLFDPALVEEVYRVVECAFDPVVLLELARERLLALGGEIRLSTRATRLEGLPGGRIAIHWQDAQGQGRLDAGRVVNCTYAMLNNVLAASGLPLIPLKHELTEMALVEPPEAIRHLGITVMCGPFFSTMPYPPRGLHSLSHVRYTPHCSWRDTPEETEAYQDAYEVFTAYPKVSKFPHMVRDAARYLPCLREARQVDSIWEVKTVLPLSEEDDGRPILFKHDWGLPNLTCVMGGKIDNIYDAMDECGLASPACAPGPR